MIKIVEDGIEFVMEESKYIKGCGHCKIGDPKGPGCRFSYPTLHSICCANSDKGLICTSAQKVTEEAKVYHGANRSDATHLGGEIVEYLDCGTWSKAKLLYVDFNTGTDVPFEHENGWSTVIREIKVRRLTMAQIKALHPDLEDVVLIEEEDND